MQQACARAPECRGARTNLPNWQKKNFFNWQWCKSKGELETWEAQQKMKKEAELASAETAEAKKEFTEAESEAAKVSEKFPALEGLSKLQYAEHAAETKIYEDQFKNMVRELHESERRATVESELASEFLQELRAPHEELAREEAEEMAEARTAEENSEQMAM
eukprot:s1085_g13.t1